MLYTTRNFLATGWACALPSGGFDMMSSAIVAKAFTDSFTRGSHPKSENMWFKAVISDLKPPEVCQVLGRGSQILHHKKALFKLLSQQVCTPQASSCHIENMKTSWSCQWQLLASNLVQKLPCSLNCNQFPGVTSHVPKVPLSFACFASLSLESSSKQKQQTLRNLLPYLVKLIPWKPPNLSMLQTFMTSSQVQAYPL